MQRIEQVLHIRLPPLLVEIAAACPSYGGWFGSIGDDFASHNHILSINAVFHEAGLTRYVMLNHGHDGDCHVWDKEAEPPNGESPITYVAYDCDQRRVMEVEIVAPSFDDYLDDFVRTHAPRSPVKVLRRRAKRLLASLDEPKPDDH